MRAAPPQRARTHARPRRAQSKALKEGDANLAGEHLREGLAAVLAVRVPSPEFEGQTKTRLGNPEVRKLVDGVVAAGLADALEAEPATAAAVLGKALQAARAAEAARKARHPRGCPPGLRQPRGRPAGAASGPGPRRAWCLQLRRVHLVPGHEHRCFSCRRSGAQARGRVQRETMLTRWTSLADPAAAASRFIM